MPSACAVLISCVMSTVAYCSGRSLDLNSKGGSLCQLRIQNMM